ISKKYVREYRSFLETKCFLAGRFYNDVGSHNVGRHQIGSKLNARESQIQRFSQSLYQKGFAESGNSFQQNMTAKKQRVDRMIDHIFQTDHALLYLAANCGKYFGKLSGFFFDHCCLMLSK